MRWLGRGAGGQAKLFSDVRRQVAKTAMAQRRALGTSRRTGCVDQIGEIVGPGLLLRRLIGKRIEVSDIDDTGRWRDFA